MSKIIITAIGDCCADIYTGKEVFLGGTAYNTAIAAKQAGAAVKLISALGTDTLGKQYLEKLTQEAIDTSGVQICAGKTSSITITLNEQGNPTYSAWDLGVLQDFQLKQKDSDVIAKSHIAKAILFNPLETSFRQFCQLRLPQTLKVGDFAGGSVYSPNLTKIDEYGQNLDIIIKSIDKFDNRALSFLKQFAESYNKIVIVLLGSAGSIVFTQKKVFEAAPQRASVIDTTGAGDTFTAYFLVTYFATKNITQSLTKATQAAAETVGHLGAI